MRTKLIVTLVLVAAGLVVVTVSAGSLLETNTAGFIQVKQAAVSGSLTCKLEPGMYWQGFGDINTYPEADTYYFTADRESGENRDQSLPTRFNDGAKAQISGSVRVILPTSCAELVKLHRKFHSSRGVMTKLVLPAVRKALFSTGPHMSASESYAERRAEFAALAEDQLTNGTILVRKRESETEDPLTGKKKKIWVLEKRTCEGASIRCVGGYVRDPSAFKEFGIRITNFVIDGIKYSPEVLKQIEGQRKARMDIITQKAQAQQAEARAEKANAEAKAKIAETRAVQEVRKTQRVVQAEADKKVAVLLAEQKRDAAQLDLETAKLEKQANIARGEGEATRRLAVMKADGALDKKLQALVAIHKAYAEALAKAQPGALVPNTVLGGGGPGGGVPNASSLIQLLTAKTAKDLSVEMGLPGR